LPRRRAAGGDSSTVGAYAEATADLHWVTLSAGARLDHWSIDDGHLFEETIATGAVLGSIERATPRTLWIGIRLR
jgi:vitamin B12 transporter